MCILKKLKGRDVYSHILHFFQKSEFLFGVISYTWRTCRAGFSFVLSKCLYYTPVVYTDLPEIWRVYMQTWDSPSVALHLPYFLATVVTPSLSFECLNQQICSFLWFQLCSWHQLKRTKKLLPSSPVSSSLQYLLAFGCFLMFSDGCF